jgi:ABC-type transporter MlaC component
MKRDILILVLLMIFFPPALEPDVTASESPLQIVKKTNEKILNILKSKNKIDYHMRMRVFEIVSEVTSLSFISTQVTENLCEKLTRVQCKKFADLFKKFLEVSIKKKTKRYQVKRFIYLGEEIDGDRAEVRTIAHHRQDYIYMTFLLKKVKQNWVVVNYIVDDVDAIENYKKQFNKLFKKYEYEKVIKKLKRKISLYDKQIRK